MTLDPKVYDFARLWLADGGWTYDQDIKHLAQRIEDCCTDFVADMEVEMQDHAER